MSEQIGRYRVLRKLGSGGMGEIFLARDASLERLVALKLLREEAASEPEARARFHLEAKALAALNHPGIVTIYEIGETAAGARPGFERQPEPGRDARRHPGARRASAVVARDGHDLRHAGLHAAGGASRPGLDRGERCLQPRRRALRGGGREAAIYRRERVRGSRANHGSGRAPAAARLARPLQPGARRPRRPDPVGGSREASVHGRDRGDAERAFARDPLGRARNRGAAGPVWRDFLTSLGETGEYLAAIALARNLRALGRHAELAELCEATSKPAVFTPAHHVFQARCREWGAASGP